MINRIQIKYGQYSVSCVCILLLLLSFASNAETGNVGNQLYQRCAACHLASGKGVPGMFPPLTERLGSLTETQQGRDYLVMVVQAGLMGSIRVEGSIYRGIMPAQGAAMQTEEIAKVLNYLLETFNKSTLKIDWKRFTEAEITEVISRYPKATGRDVHALRQPALGDLK